MHSNNMHSNNMNSNMHSSNMNDMQNNMSIVGTAEELKESIFANTKKNTEEVVIVNYQQDVLSSTSSTSSTMGMDCLTRSGRQTISAVHLDSGYGTDIRSFVIEYGYTFDIPPDIERLEIINEDPASTRQFTVTVNSIGLV